MREMIGQETQKMNKRGTVGERGTSLVECVVALLVLMVVSLAVVSVFNFSVTNSANTQRRLRALMVAQQRIEDVRNTPFTDLTAGTVTENNYVFDGVSHKVVRVISDQDIITTTAAPGPERKTIAVTVTPFGSKNGSEAITLTTIRSVNRPGPNRQPNPNN